MSNRKVTIPRHPNCDADSEVPRKTSNIHMTSTMKFKLQEESDWESDDSDHEEGSSRKQFSCRKTPIVGATVTSMDSNVLATLEEIRGKVDMLAQAQGLVHAQDPRIQVQEASDLIVAKNDLKRERMEHQATLSRLSDTESMLTGLSRKLTAVRKDFEEYKMTNDAKLERIMAQMASQALPGTDEESESSSSDSESTLDDYNLSDFEIEEDEAAESVVPDRATKEAAFAALLFRAQQALGLTVEPGSLGRNLDTSGSSIKSGSVAGSPSRLQDLSAGLADEPKALSGSVTEPKALVAEPSRFSALLTETQEPSGLTTKPKDSSACRATPKVTSDPVVVPKAPLGPTAKPKALSGPVTEPVAEPYSFSARHTQTQEPSGSTTKPKALSDPATKPKALSDPATKPKALSDPATKPKALSDPATKPKALSDLATKPKALSGPAHPPQDPLTQKIADLEAALHSKTSQISRMEQEHEETVRLMSEQLDNAYEKFSPEPEGLSSQDLKDIKIEALEERIAELQSIIQADSEEAELQSQKVRQLEAKIDEMVENRYGSKFLTLSKEHVEAKASKGELVERLKCAAPDEKFTISGSLLDHFRSESEMLRGQVNTLTAQRDNLQKLLDASAVPHGANSDMPRRQDDGFMPKPNCEDRDVPQTDARDAYLKEMSRLRELHEHDPEYRQVGPGLWRRLQKKKE